MDAARPARKPYPTDVTDEEWLFLAPYLALMTPWRPSAATSCGRLHAAAPARPRAGRGAADERMHAARGSWYTLAATTRRESMARSKRGATLEEVVRLAKQLSPAEQARLIEQVAPEVARALRAERPAAGVSLLGLVKDLGPAPSAEEIDEARREAWANFARG
jgi:hypothetical protein